MPSRIDRNREYDPFARVYNRHWGVDYRREALPLVKRLLLSRIAGGAKVLDVCCGTGQFTAQVRSLGFEVAGIDSSGEMIRYARENAPGVDLTVADVRDFSLRRKFDAAYSVYESLNHLPDLAALAQAFTRIRRHLHRGAPFLFDLNREEAYILYWNNSDSIVERDDVWIMRSEFNEATRVGTYAVTAFEKVAGDAPEDPPGGWRREDFVLHQTCHDISDACDALSKAGFRDVTLQDARDAGMRGDAGYGRTFFLAFA